LKLLPFGLAPAGAKSPEKFQGPNVVLLPLDVRVVFRQRFLADIAGRSGKSR
jgi:hypothetical protein